MEVLPSAIRYTLEIWYIECELVHKHGPFWRLSWNRPSSRGEEDIAMGYHRVSIGSVAVALLALPSQGSRADTAPKVVEEVDFAISCGPTSQEAFKHAVWTLDSFWYPEALEEFNEASVTFLTSRARRGSDQR
jgi:hypothetical protein